MQVSEARVAASRIQEFLLAPDIASDDQPVRLPSAASASASTSTGSFSSAGGGGGGSGASTSPVDDETTGSGSGGSPIVAAALGSYTPSAATTPSASTTSTDSAGAAAAAKSAVASAVAPDASSTEPLSPAAAASRLAHLTGDGSLPADEVVIEARQASFEWAIVHMPGRGGGRPGGGAGGKEGKEGKQGSSSAGTSSGSSATAHTAGAASPSAGIPAAVAAAAVHTGGMPHHAPAVVPVAGAAVVHVNPLATASAGLAAATSPAAAPGSASPTALPAAAVSASSGSHHANAGIFDISFAIRRGQVVGIVGEVGSGKSSLLAALLGQLRRKGGAFAVRGSIAFAAQAPWIFNASVRENILFGAPHEPERYASVVRMCALEADIANFPGGDACELGDRGLNASGGQKARIALARAVYADREIYLLDDPLSAVDVRTGRALWRDCVVGGLAGRGKTVLIATHQLQYLSDCDAVIVMRKGRVVDVGPLDELRARGSLDSVLPADHASAGGDGHGGGGMNDVVDSIGGGDADGNTKGTADGKPAAAGSKAASAAEASNGSKAAEAGTAATAAAGLKPALQIEGSSSKPGSRRGSGLPSTAPLAGSTAGPATLAPPLTFLSPGVTAAAGRADAIALAVGAPPSVTTSPGPAPAAAKAAGKASGVAGLDQAGSKLIAAEERATGSVSVRTLAAYASAAAGSAWVLAPVLTVLILSKGSRQVSDWFLSYWVAQAPPGSPTSTHRLYLGIYAAIILGVFVTALLQGIVFVCVTLGASRVFHNRVFASVMRGTAAWFDTQPVGRILARFTADMDLIDNSIPGNVEQTAEMVISVLISLGYVVAILPWFLVPLVVFSAAFFFLARIFRRSARDLKRIDNLSKSPLVQHLQASLQGMATIRSYGQQARFNVINQQLVDETSKTHLGLYAANRWLASRLDGE